MAELIDRQALINAYCEGCPYLKSSLCGVCEAVKLIKEAPAVDAVEVVRCKDCKYFGHTFENDTYCGCVGGLSDPEEHDFCSYGEWREENAD